MTVYVKVNPVQLKERIVESAIAHSATVEKYGSDSPQAKTSLSLLAHYADHLYWSFFPEDTKEESRNGPVFDPDAAIRRLTLIKMQHEVLLLKRGY